jgi:hypothetical protein
MNQPSAQGSLEERFAQPQAIDDVTLAFPAGIRHLMPKMDEIPAAFDNQSNPYVRFQQEWFYRGVKKDRVAAKPGIDARAAWRHLSAIQGSFEPKHEHKEAAVAYLASLWFDLVPSQNEESKR